MKQKNWVSEGHNEIQDLLALTILLVVETRASTGNCMPPKQEMAYRHLERFTTHFWSFT